MSEGTTSAYRGLVGAVPYAFRRSESRLFRLYLVVATVLAVFLTVFFALGFVVFVASTVDTTATLSLSSAFLTLIGLAILGPVLAPILFVARRHRLGPSRPGDGYDRRLALAGFAFLLSLYVGLIPTVPPEHRAVPEGAVTIASVDVGGTSLAPAVPAVVVDGVVAPVIAGLYGLPPFAGIGVATVGAALIYYVHRHSR